MSLKDDATKRAQTLEVVPEETDIIPSYLQSKQEENLDIKYDQSCSTETSKAESQIPKIMHISESQVATDDSKRKLSSEFLRKRLTKGHKYFDSGDYQMAKHVPLQDESVQMMLPSTGNLIPTPDTVPKRKASIT